MGIARYAGVTITMKTRAVVARGPPRGALQLLIAIRLHCAPVEGAPGEADLSAGPTAAAWPAGPVTRYGQLLPVPISAL